MLKVNNISYKIGNRYLLKEISFEAGSGEMVAVLGANGAGKSTLLKLLSREYALSDGNIYINYRTLEDYSFPELAKFRAVLSQHNSLAMSFTVEELIMMGRYPHFNNRPSLNDREIVQTVMWENGLTHLASRDYNTLSGGERQRAQLARVMAQIYDAENGYLFLDEPTNGLDLLYQQQTLQMARKIADKGFIVLCILHDINFASTYADKILMLKNGTTVDFGSPEKVINAEAILEVFNVQVRMMTCEGQQCPLIVPFGVASLRTDSINHS